MTVNFAGGVIDVVSRVSKPAVRNPGVYVDDVFRVSSSGGVVPNDALPETVAHPDPLRLPPALISS